MTLADFPIAQLGNPILHQVARPIENFADLELQQLIDEMMASLQKNNGVGLAAPQVERSLQLLIVASRPNPRYPDAPTMRPTVMANPKILARSQAMEKGWEGCLSVPGIRGFVPRHQTIEVSYCDREGSHHQQVLEGFVARIFQHEFDHLEGFVFLDRVESNRDLISEAEYLKQLSPADFTQRSSAEQSLNHCDGH